MAVPLTLSDFSVKHKSTSIVSGLNLQLATGEIFGILGPSGSGKSVLLKAIAGITHHKGTRTIVGHKNPPAHLTHRLLSYISPSTVPSSSLSIEQWMRRSLNLGLMTRKRYKTRYLPVIESALQTLRIKHMKQRALSELSQGEWALVRLASTLCQPRPLLLLDDPLSSLDVAQQRLLFGILKQLSANGTTVMCALHDIGLTQRWCSRALLLNHGLQIAVGSVEELTKTRVLEQVFGLPFIIATCGTHTYIHAYGL